MTSGCARRSWFTAATRRRSTIPRPPVAVPVARTFATSVDVSMCRRRRPPPRHRDRSPQPPLSAGAPMPLSSRSADTRRPHATCCAPPLVVTPAGFHRQPSCCRAPPRWPRAPPYWAGRCRTTGLAIGGDGGPVQSDPVVRYSRTRWSGIVGPGGPVLSDPGFWLVVWLRPSVGAGRRDGRLVARCRLARADLMLGPAVLGALTGPLV